MSHSYNLRKRSYLAIDETTEKVAKVAKRTKTKEHIVTETEEDVGITRKTKLPKAPKASKAPKTEPKKESKSAALVQPKSEPMIEPKSEDRNCLIFGQDGCGEFGLGKIGFTKKQPTTFPLGRVRQVACGPMHVIILLETGEIYTNGCNDEGALGRVTKQDEILEATPTIVPIPSKVVKVTAGDSHSAVLTDKGEVFVMGNFRDEGGSVGLTPESNGEATLEPIQILPKIKLKDIASGSNHMLLLDDKGVVYSFGTGEQGQLGRIKTDDLSRVTEENRNLLLTPLKVDLSSVDPSREFICDRVFAGSYSSFATNTDKKKNRLAGWGLNNYYQLGYKGQKEQIVQNLPKRSTFTCSTSMINVACGQHHTLFLTKTGRLHAAGRNQYGMLGIGDLVGECSIAKPVKSIGDDIVDISTSINTSFAVNRDGELFSWGMGGLQLGHGNEDDITKPKKVESLIDKKLKTVSSGNSFTAVLIETCKANLTYVKLQEV